MTKPLYALAAVIVFLIEILIAVYAKDSFVRPYLGDILAVILVYLALRAATHLNPLAAAITTLGIAFAIEFAQYFNLITYIGWQDFKVTSIVLGSHYDVKDLMCYVIGVALILVYEALLFQKRQ